MFKSLLALKKGDLENVEDKMMYPLLRWCSGDIVNLSHCNFVNKYFFYIPPAMSKPLLSYGLRDCKIGRYPKSVKFENKKIQTITPYLKQLYKYSKKDIEYMLPLLCLLVEDSVFIEEIDKKCNMENKDSKVFGIKKQKLKVPKITKEKKVQHNFW